jgi:hypothetical protein
MHFVRASTWGMRSLRYRENFRGTRASSKPNRRRVESRRDLMATNLLVTWALAGTECCGASWAQAWRGGQLRAGYTTMMVGVAVVNESDCESGVRWKRCY